MALDFIDFLGKGDVRDYLNSPMQIDEYTVASNGHVLAFYKADAGHNDCKPSVAASIRKMISDTCEQDFYPLDRSSLKIPEKEDCRWCDGTGKLLVEECEECEGDGELMFDSGFNHYWVGCEGCAETGKTKIKGEGKPCDHCKGSGKAYCLESHVVVEKIPVNPNYLNLILAGEDLKVSAVNSEHRLYFESGPYKGIIMAMHVEPRE